LTDNQKLKLLTSKEEIKTFLGNITDYMFKKYVERGMPARFEDGRWFAHPDNIERWALQYTNVSMRKIINQIPEI